MARLPIPSSSPSSRAASCTTSSPGPTFAICSTCCQIGPEAASSSSLPRTGSRLSSKRKLSGGLPTIPFGAPCSPSCADRLPIAQHFYGALREPSRRGWPNAYETTIDELLVHASRSAVPVRHGPPGIPPHLPTRSFPQTPFAPPRTDRHRMLSLL